MIRLLIAGSSAVVCAGLESLAASDTQFETIGSAQDVMSLNSLAAELQPDLVLASLPPSDALLALAGRYAVVLLGDGAQAEWTRQALRSGARAILPPEASRAEIVAALKAAAGGLVVLHPQDVPGLLAPADRTPAAESQLLTPREVEVLRMMAEGLGNKTLAWKLGISEHTVKFHVASILSKLDAGSRTEAVTLGIRRGLVPL